MGHLARDSKGAGEEEWEVSNTLGAFIYEKSRGSCLVVESDARFVWSHVTTGSPCGSSAREEASFIKLQASASGLRQQESGHVQAAP